MFRDWAHRTSASAGHRRLPAWVAERSSRYVPTPRPRSIPGQRWFSYVRSYGPLEPYLDRSW